MKTTQIILLALIGLNTAFADESCSAFDQCVFFNTQGYEGPAVVLRPDCKGFEFHSIAAVQDGEETVFTAHYQCAGEHKEASLRLEGEKEFWEGSPTAPMIIAEPDGVSDRLKIQWWGPLDQPLKLGAQRQ